MRGKDGVITKARRPKDGGDCRVGGNNLKLDWDELMVRGTCQPAIQHLDLNAEPAELISKQECLKSIRDLNRETARYCMLVHSVGSTVDSSSLREELKRTRRKAHELARINKTKLLPHLRGRLCKKDEVEEYEKLWTTFCSCLEILLARMWHTLTLMRSFPLHSDQIHLIRSGQLEAAPGMKLCSGLGDSHHDLHASTSAHSDKDDTKSLQKDINTISSLLSQSHDIVDIKPWAIEPDVDTSKMIEITCKSAASNSGASTEVMVTVYNTSQHRRRKCICLLSLIALAIAVVVTLIAVCIVLLS